MSKYCMQCGKEIENNANHCPFCGASQDTGFDTKELNGGKNKSQSSSLLVPIVAIVSIIAVIIIVTMNLTIFNNAYEEPVDNFLTAIEKGDGDYLEEVIPDYMIDDDDDLDDTAKKLKAAMVIVVGEDFDLDYEIIEKEEIEDSKLKKIEKNISSKYDEDVDVDAGYNLKVEISIESDEKDESTETNISVYKIDGKWCMIDDISSSMFS